MEEGTRSVQSSGVVVKNRNSSGCLIIREKSDRIGSSGHRPVFSSKKKRPRLFDSDSESRGDRLEPYHKKAASQANSGYEKGIVESDGYGRKMNSFEQTEYRNDVDDSVKKTSKLGVFEFDEYDSIDDSDDDDDDGGKSFMGSKAMSESGINREFESGSSKGDIVYKRKHSYFDRANGYGNNRFEMKRSEEPIRVQGKNGVLKVMPGKNKKGSGLLKTYAHMESDSRSRDTVKRSMSNRPSLYSEQKLHNKPGSSVRTDKNKLNLQNSLSNKNIKNTVWESDNSDSSLELRKKSNLQKSLLTKKSKALDSESDNSDTSLNLGKNKSFLTSKNNNTLNWESDDSDTSLKLSTKKLNLQKPSTTKNNKPLQNVDTSLKLGPNKQEGHKPLNLLQGKEKITPFSQKITPSGSNEGKIKRGSGTEKQKLREQIRKMLLDAGWTIDYRPRRNRDYQDAVYINPSGTAYWSIIKAYDALQKQFDENEENSLKPSGESSSFNPISELVLNKLTRQTQKKIEKELKRKRRDANSAKNSQDSAFERSAKHKRDNVNTENYSSEDNDNVNGNLSLHGRKSRKLGRCTLIVRNSKKGQNSEPDGYIPYSGKQTLLSWLIDSGTVGLRDKVQYMNRRQTRVMQEGWITRDGIHCGCCSKIITVTKFEIHAGSKMRRPFQNIYLESGISLLQCQIDAWNRQKESERVSFNSVHIDGDDPNDDTCAICGDGGDLICCDGCPSTFHQTCLGIQMLPSGDWNCPNCICKLCGMAAGSSVAENEMIDCVLPTCSFCERKYHQSCIKDVDDLPVGDSTCSPFCGKTCREIHNNLQKFLGIKHELEGGFSWSLIHRTDISGLDTSAKGFAKSVECNSKLAVALTVMDECFLPIMDRRSGINLIHNVLYNCGSNFNRLNFSGFYTAILERGDEIISAASIRFHGTQLAEMPYIGTRHIYRRQGMCSRLFRAIESALCSFKVKKMVIPAISELMHTWTEVFGFCPLEESQKEELRSMNILVFPSIDMLQKLLNANEDRNLTTDTGEKSMESEDNPSVMADMVNKDGEDSFMGHEFNTFETTTGEPNVSEKDDSIAASEDTSNDNSAPATSQEVKVSVSCDDDLCPNPEPEKMVHESSSTESKPIFIADVSNLDVSAPSTSLETSLEVKVSVSCTLQPDEKVLELPTDVSNLITEPLAEQDIIKSAEDMELSNDASHVVAELDFKFSNDMDFSNDANIAVIEKENNSEMNSRDIKYSEHMNDEISVVDRDIKASEDMDLYDDQHVESSKNIDVCLSSLHGTGENIIEFDSNLDSSIKTCEEEGKNLSNSFSDSTTEVLEEKNTILLGENLEENDLKLINDNGDASKIEEISAYNPPINECNKAATFSTTNGIINQ